MQYIALLHKDAGTDYGVSFPDFPGCVTAGSTLEDARAMAVEALALHIEGMREDGQDIPLPSPLDAIMADRENRDGVAVLIDGPPARSLRVNITMPEDVLSRIDKRAEALGTTRSGFLLRAAQRELESA